MIEDKITALETPVDPAFLHFYDFPLDPFQMEAIEHIRSNRSVMVAAPTSSGKTVVAEYALWRALTRGSHAIYTTPIKALSNQKRRDLEKLFPGQVGLLTGDRSEAPDSPIVVMTTEVLRNMLVEESLNLETVSCVVFDEVHYLADRDRGTVWEEAIITCPQHIQLVCLSATIANADEIVSWISQTHRQIALVRHDERPVPLEHLYFSGGRLHLIRDIAGREVESFSHQSPIPAPHPSEVLPHLERHKLLPAIWFAFSRRGVEEAAEACALAASRPTPAQLERIERAVAWALEGIPREDRTLPQLSALMHLLRRGVGFHHAGILPPLKELVEHLFAQGLLSVVCATDTLAVGINMPARTVVISSLSRPVGGLLSPNDFQQLTGRAGRRGIDELGAVVILPGRSYRFEAAYKEVTGPLRPVESAFRLRYSTLISALEGSDERLATLVERSLRQFQMRANARRAEIEIKSLKGELAAMGASPDLIDLDGYLALQYDLSLAEKEQRRAKNARTRGKKSIESTRRYEESKQERERLTRALRSHPLHGEAIVTEREHPERMEILRRINRLRTQVAQATQECERDATRTAEAVRTVLQKLGYMTKKRELTRKSRGLREIVAASGIVLSELYESGAFDNLNAPQLAEAISWFASDTRRRPDNRYRLEPRLFRLRHLAKEKYDRIAAIEYQAGVELTQGPSEGLFGVAHAWCIGHSLETITSRVDMAEGDIVGSLNKTVDLLDQFDSMLSVYGDTDLVRIVGEARRLLVRGLVATVRSGDRNELTVIPLATALAR